MNNHVHPIFQTILNEHYNTLPQVERCPVCEEEIEDCACEVCQHCGKSDLPIMSLDGKVCASCGELMYETGDYNDDEDYYYVKTETDALIRDGY